MAKERVVSVYVTAGSSAEAKRLARLVLTHRLAACANVVPAESLYWWKGRIVEARERVVFFKTREVLLDDLLVAVREAHSYDVPCVVVLDVLATDRDYLEWVVAETTLPSPARAPRKSGGAPTRASRASSARLGRASRPAAKSRTR